MTRFLFLSIIAFSIFSCKTNVSEFEQIGKITPRTTHQIESNNWTIGCEVLDRDYANYHYYKEYLDSLGCKTARLQSGWAKTEKVKGVYSFEWLDTIIDDLLSRNICPWLQLSYGNPIYKGGGGYSLGAGMPQSKEALNAWDKWVKASVERYKEKVNYYEIWNEGNLKGNNDPSEYAALYIRTAEIIKSIQPEAKISGLATAWFGIEFNKNFFKYIDSIGKINLVDEVTFHPYHPQPEIAKYGIQELKDVIAKYSDKITIKQGENGAPSTNKTSGALSGFDWNEYRQAKWFLRRMMNDNGNGIPTTVFTIIDFEYPSGQHTVGWNTKGILKADRSNGKVESKKLSYKAVQNVTAIFDNNIQLLPSIQFSIDSSKVDTSNLFLLKENFSLYGYEDSKSKSQLVTIWCGGKNADIDVEKFNIDISFTELNIDEPVFVNLLTGNIYEIPSNNCKKTSLGWVFHSLPINDVPVVITDKKLVVK